MNDNVDRLSRVSQLLPPPMAMPSVIDLMHRAGRATTPAEAVRAQCDAVADAVARTGLDAITRAERFRDACDDIAESLRRRGATVAYAATHLSVMLAAVDALNAQQRQLLDNFGPAASKPQDEQTR